MRTLEEVLVDDAPVLLADNHAGRKWSRRSEANKTSCALANSLYYERIGYALRYGARTSPARATGHTVSISATLCTQSSSTLIRAADRPSIPNDRTKSLRENFHSILAAHRDELQHSRSVKERRGL